MSTFEKLPQEIRDMIYEYCLIHHEGIAPFPTIEERKLIKLSGREPAKLVRDNTDPNFLSACSNKVYAAEWPSVALLGVNKTVQEDAAGILFGKNTWHLSFIGYWHEEGEEAQFWSRYAKFFRHISTRFCMHDVEPRDLSHITKFRHSLPDSYAGRNLRTAIHKDRIDLLDKSFEWKRRRLVKMNLASLVFHVNDLFCPSGCCRTEILDLLCKIMGRQSPWYTSKPSGSTTTYF
ncbi:MAG: hypothetical protein Q9161_000605 [Pseudevernia consocians]